MLQTSPIQFQDFSGGISDNFIDAPINKYKTADNFLITENRKLYTRSGLGLFNIEYAQLPVGNQRVGNLLDMDDVLLAQSGKKLYFDEGSSWGLVGDVLKDITINNYISYTNYNKQLYVASDNYSPMSKVYIDDVGDYQVRTAGMPPLATTPTLSGNAGAGSFIYAFHYFYEYEVGTVTHIDAGPVVQANILLVDEPSVSNITVNSIPVFSNDADEQYDTANMFVKIYRTDTDGEVLYLLDTVTNGTTSYVDSTSDANLLASGQTIYTTGGVLNNDTPPKAKSIHIVNGVMWYGNLQIGTAKLENRLIQSVVNDPDSAPASNYIDLDDEIIGISSYMDRALIFCRHSVYRIDGNYDEFGSGDPLIQKIADTIGCVSANSIIQTPQGIFFSSNTGFAFTDGFKCFNVSNDFNDKYSTLVEIESQRNHICGAFDKVSNRVFFSVQEKDSQNGENDRMYVCDLRWGISENMSFTTFSGTELNPTALIFHNGELIQGDYRGYVLAYREEYLSDVRIDTTLPVTSWGNNAIMYDYESAAIKPFQDTRYFMSKVLFSAKNTSNLSVQITSNTDIGNRIREIKPIRWRGNLVWGDPLFSWGQDVFQWGVQGFVEHQRYFHGDDLRGTYKQVQLTNAEVLILDDDALSTATVDPSAKTVLLDDLQYSWLEDMLGYTISFEHDGYVSEYEILSYSQSTLVVLDTAGTLPTGSGIKWTVNGIPKNEILSLLNITLLVAPLGNTQDRFTPSQLGGSN